MSCTVPGVPTRAFNSFSFGMYAVCVQMLSGSSVYVWIAVLCFNQSLAHLFSCCCYCRAHFKWNNRQINASSTCLLFLLLFLLNFLPLNAALAVTTVSFFIHHSYCKWFMLVRNYVFSFFFHGINAAYRCWKYSSKLNRAKIIDHPIDAKLNGLLPIRWNWNFLGICCAWHVSLSPSTHFYCFFLSLFFWYISNELKYENCFFSVVCHQSGQVENYHRRNKNKTWQAE